MVFTARDLARNHPLTRVVQVRLTEAQYQFVQEVTRSNPRTLSGTMRAIVLCAAINEVNDEAWLRDDPPALDVGQFVAELNALAPLESRWEAEGDAQAS